MIILGVNAYHGDASAAILVDGRLVAAVEEERFTRIKHEAGFPVNAVRFCLEAAGARLRDVDHVAVPRDPRARWARKLMYAIRLPGFALDRVRAAAQFGHIADTLARALDTDPSGLRARMHRVEHHRAHLASAFFVSPFDRAAVLSLDGLGDFASGMWGVGEGERIRVAGAVTFPHSIGLCYTAVTQFLGFPHYGDEYKVMGLAALGAPSRLAEFRRILRTDGGLGHSLDLACFRHHRQGPSMTWESGAPQLATLYAAELEARLGTAREPEGELETRHKDVAASLQARLEEVVGDAFDGLRQATGHDRLGYAGGVAFNCVANAKALAGGTIDQLYVPPAPGDAGLAIGAACHVWHEVLGRRREFAMDHSSWGPGYGEAEIGLALNAAGLAARRVDETQLLVEVARCIADGNVVGWFQGRAEFGPRALGNRSLLADPRRPGMREILNTRIKRRESFRPFAPSILEERASEWFTDARPSPFMSLTLPARPERRDDIPACLHVDGTGRLQTVRRGDCPQYWSVIREFELLTGVPVVLNTSFNENEPIVNTPAEAASCFQRREIDVLAIGPFLVTRRPEDGGPPPALPAGAR